MELNEKQQQVLEHFRSLILATDKADAKFEIVHRMSDDGILIPTEYREKNNPDRYGSLSVLLSSCSIVFGLLKSEADQIKQLAVSKNYWVTMHDTDSYQLDDENNDMWYILRRKP